MTSVIPTRSWGVGERRRLHSSAVPATRNRPVTGSWPCRATCSAYRAPWDRPVRMTALLPAIGEGHGDPGGGPALGQPGEPGQALPVHAGPVQRDEQRRRRLSEPARRPRQPVRPAHASDVNLALLELAAAVRRHAQILGSENLLCDL